MSEPFRLKYHELISGGPLFFLPVDAEGTPVPLKEAVELRGYVYTHGVRAEQMHPCDPALWDLHAFCVFRERSTPAVIAIGETAELMQRKQTGYFTRSSVHDCGRFQET